MVGTKRVPLAACPPVSRCVKRWLPRSRHRVKLRGAMPTRLGQVAQDGQRVAIALGSNLGDRRATLRDAWDAILDLVQPPADTVAVASSLYETSPIGTTTPQPDFLNAVMGVATPLEPLELLGRLQSIERQFGRRRSEPHQARTLDIDILLIGEQVIDVPGLTVPHPRLHERQFVLEPLAEIDPQWVHPRRLRSVVEMLTDLASDESARCANALEQCRPVRRISGPEWCSRSTPDLSPERIEPAVYGGQHQ